MGLSLEQKKIKEITKRAIEIKDYINSVRPLYKELDELTLKLVEMNIFTIDVGDVQLVITDNFVDKNTGFRVARFNRYDIEVEKKKGSFSFTKKDPVDMTNTKKKELTELTKKSLKKKKKSTADIFPTRKTKKK